MRLGMLARSESRGLGHMTRAFYRNMHPDRTLVVIPAGVARHGLTSHTDWYPDGTVARFDGTLNETECRRWLDGLDVVYTAETFYDWRFCAWAREAGVRTVCHLMPEWFPKVRSAEPDAWWAPTSWLFDRLPPGTRHVPVPIVPNPQPTRTGVFRWLHVAGAQTHGDRNGTNLLLRAAQHLTAEQEIVIHSQTAGVGYGEVPPNVTVEHAQPVDEHAHLYRCVDAMVMPRRYAGLSLPVLEAFGAGLPVIMPDLSPQNADWPVCTVPTIWGEVVHVYGRDIHACDIDPQLLARTMDAWVTDPEQPAKWRQAANEYAEAHSWTVWADRYRELLADA